MFSSYTDISSITLGVVGVEGGQSGWLKVVISNIERCARRV